MPNGSSGAGLKTRGAQLLGVELPIIQTGMGWVSGARLTAATSTAGGLGILASATMTTEALEIAIRKVKQRTTNPFGVNLRADQPDIVERLDLLVREGVRVASFAQAPKPEVIKRLKGEGILCIPTIGAQRHAEKVAEWGVDAVIAQGAEGGGHTGTVPTALLVEQVTSAVDIPVFAAGGITTGSGLVSMLALGASGVAMGTRFLLTQESHVPEEIKRHYLASGVNDTVVTKSIDGYPQRVINTELVRRLERSGGLRAITRSARSALELRKYTGISIPNMAREARSMRKHQQMPLSQIIMAANAPMLIKAALVDGNVEAGVLPTGQAVGNIADLPSVAQLLGRIVAEAALARDRVCGS